MLQQVFLEDLISELIDQDFTNFKGFPNTVEIASKNWSNILSQYIEMLSLPVVGSSLLTVESLRQLAELTLLNQIQNNKVSLEIVITNFVLGVSSEITSQGVFTSIMPVETLDLSSCFLVAPNYEGTASDVSQKLSQKIDSWVKSATAINNSTQLQINWS